MSFSYNSEPRVVFITQLLNELSNGELKIPRFQRELVWDWDQQRDLLCSIYEGLPIGAILMWHTRLDNIKSYDSIGPFSLKSRVDKSYNAFLMDGLQRLSTLYCTLLHPEEDIHNKDGAYYSEVYCDLDSDDIDSLFVQRHVIDKLYLDTSMPNMMPLKCILDTKKLLKFQRTIPLEFEHWIDKSEHIASVFKNYKIPVVPLESDQQDIVTKSFERINTRGTTMSETHMLNALTYSDEFDLLKEIESCRNSYFNENSTWNDIETEHILSIIKLIFNIDIYDKNTEKLAKRIDLSTLEKVFLSISELEKFSKKELGVIEPSKFPYKIQLLLLAYAFASNSKISLIELKAWYIISTYTGAFGITARNSLNAIEDFKKYLETGNFSWSLNFKPSVRKWSKNTNTKSARAKAWMLALTMKYENNLNYSNSSQIKLTSNKSRHLKLPTEFEPENLIKSSLRSRAGMHFFISSEEKIGLSLLGLNEDKMGRHFTSNYILGFLKDGRYEDFCNEREQLIFDWEVENIVKPAAEILKFFDINYE
ncbi:DUF262 domain-containing protein [Vibrio splendidus]